MVFPSIPIYLDPHNWSQQQQPNHQQAGISSQNPPALQLPPSTMSVESGGNSGGGGGYQGSIRPGSMADRARLAKIHQVDAVLKCPRCESTNTKFCYYNNYNLSQPRHFCKTCRRYWTRGGALRNVPVGGGCRRNKRSKGNNTNASKSHVAGGFSASASANSSTNNGCTTTTTTTNSNGNMVMGNLPTQFPFLSSLQHYSNTNNSDYLSGGIGSHFGTTPTSSLVAKNIGNSSSSSNVEFQIGNGSSNGGNLLLSNGIGEQWRFPNMQQVQQQQQQQQQQQRQFAFMTTNLEPQIGLFQFGHNNGENNVAEPSSRFISSKAMDTSSVNTIKMEESNQQGMNLPKNLLSGSGNSSNLFWNGGGSGNNAWSEVPTFTSSPSHY